MKKTLQRRAYHQETFLMEPPLMLLEETEVYDGLDTEPMTSEMMDEPEEAEIIEEVVCLGNQIFFRDIFRDAASPKAIVWERLKFY